MANDTGRAAFDAGAFGEVVSDHLTPRIQIDAVYSIRTTDHETNSATGGGATASESLFVCTTGTQVGGYGVVQSKRLIRYRPGQGIRFRGTAAFTTGVANSVQYLGLLTATDVPFAIAVVGVTNTTELAEALAESTAYTGWVIATSPTSNGATVTFIQATPAAAAGAYTLSSTGTAAGTFATLQAGVANDKDTGFVAQTAWNFDKMDGSGPSGMVLDPTKLNVYSIVYPFLGAGPTRWYIYSPDTALPHLVHVERYPNIYTVPNQNNPIFRVGWVAASLGSTTALTVKGASAAAFVEGDVLPLRNPNAINVAFSATTTEQVALALRVRGEFASTVNRADVLPHDVSVGVETSNRLVAVRIYLNPTMTGALAWAYKDQSTSVIEYSTPTALAPSGGQLIATGIAPTGAPCVISLHELDVRIQPGDTLVVTLDAVSNTATCQVGINWQEN